MKQPREALVLEQRRHRSVIRNERLTALAGGVLFVLFLLELAVTVNLRQMILVHIFIGTLLAGPLVVKLTSVGYRFFGYYLKSPAFVAKGPPNIWLRLLAPFFLLLTLTLFLSGLALILVGPSHAELFKLIHAGSAALWVPLLVVHVYAHIREVPRSVKAEWGLDSQVYVSGRMKRLRINLIALVLGTLGAVALMPMSRPWIHGPLEQGIPAPLILGLFAAIPAMIIAVPVLRRSRP
jgi:hypothetical protein